ncbi:MAG: ATP-binding cassette domain-containing protein [Bdellovibrio sp.]|nr:ATP-binding cassette domain-containing protein [Bdellovibrio sp.]
MTMNRTTWLRLLSLTRSETKPLLWGLFFLIVSSAAGLAYPQLTRWLIDHVLTPKRLDLLVYLAFGLFAAFLIQGVTSSLRYYLFTLSGERIVIRLRARLYKQILSQEVSFFDFNRTGELMSRLASDCTTLQNAVSVNVSMGLRNVGTVIGGMAFMFYTSWRLSLLMLILIPPVAFAAALFGKRIRQFSKEAQSSLAEASIVAEETISAIRTVKSFVQEQDEVSRYQGSMEEALLFVKKRIRATAEFISVAMIAGFGAISFVLWYGGREVILDRMSAGDITQFLLYLALVAISVGSLGSLWGDLMSAVGASQRVFEILERLPAVEDEGSEIANLKGLIEFKNVHFSYPTRKDMEVLKGLNLQIQPGQMVALVGSSGSGKSTLAGLLPRFYEPTSGSIALDGKDLSSLKPSWLRGQIGIVSQEPVLISSTIEENIRYGNTRATDQEVETAAKAANALDFIQQFPEKFKTRVGEKGLQLSGGQKQRVAIARALLKNPKLLILDEATSNLDTASEHLVQEALQRLTKGRTTLVIAHRLSTIIDADVIFVVHEGHIVQSGKHEDLATNKSGLYFQLLQRQIN